MRNKELAIGLAGRSTLDDLDPAARAAFSERLRAIVELVGTQAKAAEVAGVSLAQLKNYLSGTSAPGFIAVGRLAGAAAVSLEWVLTGQGDQRRAEVTHGEVLREAVEHGKHGLVGMRVARRLGGAVERLYGVAEFQLPEPIDDTIEPIADQVARLTRDESGAAELVQRIVALVAAVAHDPPKLPTKLKTK